MPRKHDIALGESNFLLLRENARNYFVDKSHFITRVLTDASPVQLFPRPRRFGKTLNLTMLKAFVERDLVDDEKDWPHGWAFEGLQVMQDADFVACHAGKYPVIFLTFKDIKVSDWQGCLKKILMLLSTEIWRHLGKRNLDEDSRSLAPMLRQSLSRIIYGEADAADAETVLLSLAQILSHLTGQKVMILIDEYDTPILSAWTHGYYDEAITFFRNFLGAGLKDNPYLAKGVLTGILHIAKESVFSGLNNLEVYSLLRRQHACSFGFTQDEVSRVLDAFELLNHSHQITQWYDGYIFGDTTIFNPWSILNFLKAPEEGCRPYWLNTSSNDLVRELVLARAASDNDRLQQELHRIAAGAQLEKVLDDHIVLRSIRADDDSLWHLLAMTGYLKAQFAGLTPDNRRQVYRLAIPNLEVSLFYEDTLQAWLNQISGDAGAIPAMLRALLQGRMDDFALLLQEIALAVLSYHDVGGKAPERFYHALLLGMFLNLRMSYEVTSNRESGLGRYDMALIPKTAGQRGFIIELKKALKKDRLEAKAQEALEQAQAREYVTVLRQRGANPLVLVGIALRGKDVMVRWAQNGS